MPPPPHWMTESSNLIVSAKENYYYKNEGKKLLDPSLCPKKYWSILNSFLGKKENAYYTSSIR